MKKRASQYSWNVFLPKVQASFSAARTTELDLDQANGMIGMANALGQMASLVTGQPYVPQDLISEKEKYHWALVGEVNASLTLSLAYIGKIRAAKVDYECGKITWEQSQKQTLMNIKKLFYGLLLQQEK